MNNIDDEQDRQPVPRAWREEFDGLKPIRPIVYRRAPKREDPQGADEREQRAGSK